MHIVGFCSVSQTRNPFFSFGKWINPFTFIEMTECLIYSYYVYYVISVMVFLFLVFVLLSSSNFYSFSFSTFVQLPLLSFHSNLVCIIVFIFDVITISSVISGVSQLLFHYFLFFFYLYWCIIALQWCVSFCFITKWISYTYTYIPISPPSCVSLPSSLSCPLGGHKARNRSPCAMRLLRTS